MHGLEVFGRHVRVSLGGLKVRVPHDLLQQNDVSAPAQIAGCVRVPGCVTRPLFSVFVFRHHLRDVENFRLVFAYTVAVFNVPTSRRCNFAIRSKGCGETIPAPVETMPDNWIVAECPLCCQRRRYLPSEIFRGALSHLLSVKNLSRRSAHG
jgi:hypothetical protein